EAGENRELIKNIKTGLFGPLAGFGDAIVWFTCLPITAAIAATLAKEGSIIGPIFFLAFWILLSLARIPLVKFGYNLGAKAVSTISKRAVYITKCAGILGVMVLGAMIPNYVSFSFNENLMLFGTVGVQSIFDSIIANLLPAMIVGLMYYLFKKKVNIVVLIVGVIVACVLLSFLGWV
ncbi:MAG: PTS system mannose/fructose/sorbose family transporter subunit IID, partial [Erysipelotrichaceae bacterium]|nr:PTS system mannose/fructose/sorbose family transporter subunit IID [Erysipelotrichaceae bacterium]